jgi:hypothetical protein
VRELFIYYRVEAAKARDARAAVLAMQARLHAERPHIVARLMQRDDGNSELQTWMETYRTDPRHDAAGIGVALQAAIESASSDLQACVEGTRHTEVFIACAS